MPALTCAAIDLGATSGRVIVGTLDQGRLELEEVHRFPNSFGELAGRAYWDLGALFAHIRAGLHAALRGHPRLRSCGVDTWGVDTVLTDAAGRLVYPGHAYRDTRTQDLFDELGEDGIGRVYKWTGIPNLPYNTSLQLAETVETHPAVRRLAERCLFLPDYLNFLLSGRMVNEVSIASTSQLLALGTPKFSRRALRYFDLPRRWFARPTMAGARLGPITCDPELARIEVVLVPGHDTACAYAAMPAAEDGSDAYISSGTWSLIGFESDRPLTGKKALELGVCNERMGDGRFRPLKSSLGLWLLEQTFKAFGEPPQGDAAWSALLAAARAAPAPKVLIDTSDHSLFHPSAMRPAIDAHLRARGGTPPTDLPGYTRLIVDSLGAAQAAAIRALAELADRRFQRILMVGGGSKNPLLCQATADASGLPVASSSLEGSALGNLGQQFITLGALPSLAAWRRIIARTFPATTYAPSSAAEAPPAAPPVRARRPAAANPPSRLRRARAAAAAAASPPAAPRRRLKPDAGSATGPG